MTTKHRKRCKSYNISGDARATPHRMLTDIIRDSAWKQPGKGILQPGRAGFFACRDG